MCVFVFACMCDGAYPCKPLVSAFFFSMTLKLISVVCKKYEYESIVYYFISVLLRPES